VAVYLAVVRLATCEICLGQFYIEGDGLPDRCPHCGSTMWLYGIRTDRSSAYIRKGINKTEKVLNKGVTSAKRQAHGQKQWRSFKSKDHPDNKSINDVE
jgi:hypothetical protein